MVLRPVYWRRRLNPFSCFYEGLAAGRLGCLVFDTTSQDGVERITRIRTA